MRGLMFAACFALVGTQLYAQSPPRFVPAAGVVHDAAGAARNGPAVVTFAIYAAQEGGEPIWKETQSLTLDAAGRYSTLLGVTQPDGLPTELFNKAEARWLAVSVDGGPEGPRMFWASVPYALKAGDAETVGGLPLDAFMLNGKYPRPGAPAALPPADRDGVPAGAAGLTDNPNNEFTANGDLYVYNAACVGVDCVENAEAFGSDSIRLKENNLRIHFDDTSVGTFPANDWRIVANDTASGGANYLAFEDSTAGRTPFKVEAGARTNALYVDSTGRIGIGTATPVLDTHTVTSNTPAMRLEQNNSGGFSPQTWDIAGNEANFFIRDVTGGSRLPFKIFPGAPTNSLDVAASGNVGVGTASPGGNVDIQRTGTDVTLHLTNTSGQRWEMKNNNATGRLTFGPVGGNVPFKFSPTAAENLLRVGVLNANTVDINGNLVVTGGCTGCLAPDYVFEPDYRLRPLAELEAYVKDNKHLPGVPSAADIDANGINMREMNYALLEKIEELVLYTLQQQKAIDDLQQRLRQLESEKQEKQ